jgi:GntR family transcriptional regulator
MSPPTHKTGRAVPKNEETNLTSALGTAKRDKETVLETSLAAALQLRDDTAMPLYQQLEEQLHAMISDGRLPAGTILPAERHLANSLGISRVTVQRAYATLRQRRLLSAHGRRGFRVEGERPRLHPGLDRLKGFTEEMRELGKAPSSRVLEQKVVTDRSIASLFGLPSSAPLLKLVRVRCGDNVPLSREVGWYNLTAAPKLDGADLSGSVYAFLALHDVPLLSCDQAIEAVIPSEKERKIFGFSLPIPCLLLKRSSYTRNQIMIEYVEGLFRGDLYSYHLKLNA